MGKKTKKVGLIGDFSDEEDVETTNTTEEPISKKGGKKHDDASDDEEANGKQTNKKETNGKQKKKATPKGKTEPEDEDIDASSDEDTKKAPTKGSKEDKKQPKKGKKDKASKVENEDEEIEEGEESKPKKKSTEAAQAKKPKKKKGGNWKEYEEDEEEQEEQPTASKKTSKAEEAKGKDQTKKQEAKKSKDEEDEPESEESDEPKKGKGKGKPKKQDAQKSKQQPDDEDVPAKEDKEVAPKKKGKKKVDDYWDQEYEKDAEAAAAAAPQQPEEEPDAGSGKKNKKKKKPTKEEGDEASAPAPAQKDVKETKENTSTKPAKTDSSKETKENTSTKSSKTDSKQPKAPKGMSKALEMLRKQKEEQERVEREAEEQRKKEEEEERIQLEEERKLEAERQKIKDAKIAAKKLAKAEAKANQPEKQKAGDAAFLQQLREKGLLPKEATPSSAPGGKPKTKIYQTTKKKPQKKADTTEEPVDTTTSNAPAELSANSSVSEPSPSASVSVSVSDPPVEDEAVDDWENWEDHVDDVAKKLAETNITTSEQTKPKTDEANPALAKPAEAAQVPTSTPAPAQQKKPDENGKGKGGKKDNKKPTKRGKPEVKPPEDENPETSEKELRSPICCILGHVDTGKTSLLDKIRQTDVQGGEAGGITQQIGATYFPMSAIQEKTQSLSEKFNLQMKVPGLLVIDTPGHESFTNLRSRGSGLCDIAILVVDIMHALEPQTIESINLLRMRKTPFVVALNKVDRIYGWRSKPFNPFRDSLKLQDKSAVLEFETRTKETISAFAEHSLNATLYYKNTDFRKYVSLVPTSAHTGEGIPDLLMLLVQLTQKMMPERLHFSDEVQCTVLEVKVIEGLGTTLDVILVNGMLHEGDTIVLCGINGPIVTTIRAVLAPQPLRELRVKGSYEKLKEIKAAMGVKIVAQDLEKAIAGSALFVANTEEDIEDLKEEVQSDFDSVLNSVDSSSRGVCVQASTLGSLEALLTFLKSSKIPVSGVSIGPIHKRDVIRASVMLEHNPEFAVILAFDVKVEKDAQELADKSGVQIFTADIIYHLFDRFTAYMDGLKQKKREAAGDTVVWPCIVRIKPDCIFNKKAPLVLGMDIVSGTLRLGTPLCVPNKNFVDIGVVTGIEKNHKQQQEAKKGDEVAVKIESSPENAKEFGKHFDAEHDVCSRISRESIDTLVSLWGEELSQTDRQLIVKLKGVFKIQ